LEEYKIIVDAKLSGKRIDIFLVEYFKHKFSRTFIRKLIDDGKVTIHNECQKAKHIVHENDVLHIEIPPPETLSVEAEDIPLDIVYEDKDVCVVNKQAGLVVHPAPGNAKGTLVNALLFHCRDLSGIGGALRPGIVHRLDKDTSGLIVVAKNDMAHTSLSNQFKSREAGRVYIALVKGKVEFDNGIIELPIGRHHIDRKRMEVAYSDSKDAKTRYTVLKRFNGFSVLELKLETGRTHQIRVHLAHLGYPILGDRTYGSGKGMKRQADNV
jgi:23S rRNA pseudouridine1911/1915/1917 synthase